jgi:hypothetical protein
VLQHASEILPPRKKTVRVWGWVQSAPVHNITCPNADKLFEGLLRHGESSESVQAKVLSLSASSKIQEMLSQVDWIIHNTRENARSLKELNPEEFKDVVLEPDVLNLLRGKVFKVKRSSGAIESGWSLQEGASIDDHGRVEAMKGAVSRPSDIQELLELNPELSPPQIVQLATIGVPLPAINRSIHAFAPDCHKAVVSIFYFFLKIICRNSHQRVKAPVR